MGKIFIWNMRPPTHSSSAGSRGRMVSSTIFLKIALARRRSTTSPSSRRFPT